MKTSTGTTKFFVAGLILLTLAILVFVQAAFNLAPFNINPSQPDQILLLYTLSTFIFLVLIIFAFVLLRSLFKLWIESKEEKPGAKFKTKLVLSLISLTLIPTVVLFVFSFGLVNRSIDKWFSAPVDKIFQTTEELETQWAREHSAVASGILSQIANQLPRELEETVKNLRLKALAIFDADGNVLRGSSEVTKYLDLFQSQLTEIDASNVKTIIEIGGLLVGIHRLDGNPELSAIAAVFHTPEYFQELTTAVSAEQASYNELIQNRRFYRDTYVYILALITVLVLFAAVWIGLYFSKKITIPIEALSGATKELSSGNLNHRVTVQAEDELGMLVSLFNDMAGQLQLTTNELNERRRYTEIILEAIPTGVVSIDDEFSITKMNRASRTMFSIEKADKLEDVFTKEDLTQIGELLRVSRQEGTLTREITLTTSEGLVHSAVTASLLATGGYLLVVEDLTELVKAQKATAWREVARRLAHEIKNPLTPIQLSAERIARNAESLPDTQPKVRKVIKECVSAISEEVTSLKALVNEFGRFARLPEISREPTEVKTLVEKTLSLYEDRFNGTNVISNIPENFPPVFMDGKQIKRVLINLIDNAIEAMAEAPSKELIVQCELVHDQSVARLTVTDTGSGIDPKNRELLFAPYFSTRKNGTGLGLAIASRIVADHGGFIGAESNNPHGSKFVVELPLCQESS